MITGGKLQLFIFRFVDFPLKHRSVVAENINGKSRDFIM